MDTPRPSDDPLALRQAQAVAELAQLKADLPQHKSQIDQACIFIAECIELGIVGAAARYRLLDALETYTSGDQEGA